MDVPEADYDIKLQKISTDLLTQFDETLADFLRKSDGRGSTTVRSRVRSRELFGLTNNNLDPFQELPQLLDPYLPKWIPFLSDTYLQLLQTRGRRSKQLHDRSNLLISAEFAVCKLLYTFCKIRGEKVIVRFLNVEAKHLELLVTAIEDADVPDGESETGGWQWEQRYIVLLWLSHLLLAPFDLSTISSVDVEDMVVPDIPNLGWPKAMPGIAVRAIALGVRYLASPGRERDAAKALMVRISMRRDMQQLGLLDSLVKWALNSLGPGALETNQTAYFYLGVLSFIAGALRSASDTSDMTRFLHDIFATVISISSGDTQLSKSIIPLALARKMILKIMRAVVVSLLRQPSRSIADDEATETAIGHLLESVADNDTPVRFAASKALSIITLTLDPEMAGQVVEAVLEALNRNVLWTNASPDLNAKPVRDLSAVNHLEWHGLILTLSHLLYRRSPPAAQLADIVHALLIGLAFEQRSTSGTTVGANVRDAACFGIWAIARRYTTEELLAVPTGSVVAARTHPEGSSILQVLATELVTTACLDPAGNIRRGSSAALQELIGRHPDTVEQGIWVVQKVDYHAVARRSRALEEVALGATSLSARYGEAVLDGILGWRGIGDADASSRRDSARAFGALTAELASSTPDAEERLQNAARNIGNSLVLLADRQVEEHHGFLLCYASLIEQLPSLMLDGGFGNELADLIIRSVTVILRDIDDVNFRRPELVAEGASGLVVALAPLLQALIMNNFDKQWSTIGHLRAFSNCDGITTIATALDHDRTQKLVVDEFVSAAGKVIPAWLSKPELQTTESVSEAAMSLLIFSHPRERRELLETWTNVVRSKPTSRAAAEYGIGFLQALAIAQPLANSLGTAEPGTDIVCQAFLERWGIDNHVETRVAVLQSLARSRMLQERSDMFTAMLVDGLNDYTTDARGDIGSHVRVQALRAVQRLWQEGKTGPVDGKVLSESLATILRNVLRLAAEKLDRIRPEAQQALALLFRDESRADFCSMTFSSRSYFARLLNLLRSDDLLPPVRALVAADEESWTTSLMAGFVTSADTGNDDLVIASRAALTAFCDTSASDRTRIASALLGNLKSHQGNDRVVVPTLEIVSLLFKVDLIGQEELNLKSLCLQTQKAGYKTGNVRKIEACVGVYGGIARSGHPEAAQEARKRLGALLFHPWPKVRTLVTDQLWGLLNDGAEGSTGDVGAPSLESSASSRLLGTDWGSASKAQVQALVEELRLN